MNLWFIMLLSQNKKRNKTQNKTWSFFQNMMMGFSSWNIWRYGILVSTWWFSFLQATLMTSEFSMSVAWFLVSTIAVIMGRPQSTITKQWWPSLSRVYFLVLYSLFLHVLYIYIYYFFTIIPLCLFLFPGGVEGKSRSSISKLYDFLVSLGFFF